jgi:hypothetical protein
LRLLVLLATLCTLPTVALGDEGPSCDVLAEEEAAAVRTVVAPAPPVPDDDDQAPTLCAGFGDPSCRWQGLPSTPHPGAGPLTDLVLFLAAPGIQVPSPPLRLPFEPIVLGDTHPGFTARLERPPRH